VIVNRNAPIAEELLTALDCLSTIGNAIDNPWWCQRGAKQGALVKIDSQCLPICSQ
jgi:hypothetical protein